MIAPLRDTADRLLRRDAGTGLTEFVLERRAAGIPWAAISGDLSEASDGVLLVTPESLRLWFGPPARAA